MKLQGGREERDEYVYLLGNCNVEVELEVYTTDKIREVKKESTLWVADPFAPP